MHILTLFTKEKSNKKENVIIVVDLFKIYKTKLKAVSVSGNAIATLQQSKAN